ncbi:FAD-binding oxidoreductase [Alloactinosynnema sp. L-07]|uniref:FAD-binding oxidoreductase n=1 Tax=Alloactinosynnema sp. L-07 TaxID=1653480 RepID=UPI0006B475AC|nr:FAD-dependent oxidoreductase [Alloactinosynnema sp. L-07]
MTSFDERDASIALPGDPAYVAATRVFNLAAPVTPAAALTARTVNEIRAGITYARSAGLSVRVHTTGHSAGAAKPMAGAVLIRTELDGAVEVDPDRRVARIPAGTQWKAVVEATSAHGLTAPHGSSGTVGIVGYLLRGGISFYGRQTGLAVNHVRGIELVTPDGELVWTDADNDPDLFWALRGGGGGFGVVTAIEVDLFPASTVVTGAAFWPGEHARTLLTLWDKWCRDAPNAVSTSFRVLNLPPFPGVPEVLSGGTMICVDGVVLGGADDSVALGQADDLLAPLRAVAEPVMDTWHLTTPQDILATHMDPEDPVPAQGDHFLLTELTEDTIDEFVKVFGPGTESPLVMAGLRQLGGNLAQPSPTGGALDHLTAPYLYSGAGIPLDADTSATINDRLELARAALSPWDSGRTAPTFIESPTQPQGHLTPEAIARVDEVRARLDPKGLFKGDVMTNTTARPF